MNELILYTSFNHSQLTGFVMGYQVLTIVYET